MPDLREVTGVSQSGGQPTPASLKGDNTFPLHHGNGCSSQNIMYVDGCKTQNINNTCTFE